MGKGYVVGLLAGALLSGVSVSALSLILSPAGVSGPDVAEVTADQLPEPAPEAAVAEPQAEPAPVAEAPAPVVPEPAPAAEAPAPVPQESAAETPVIPEPAETEPAETETAAVTQPLPEPAPEPAVPAEEPVPEPAPVAEAPATPEATEQAALTPRPETPVVDVPAGSEFNRPKPEVAPVVPAPQPAPAASATPEVTAPAADTGPTLTEQSPAAIPQGQAEAPAALGEPAGAAPEAAVPAPADEVAVPVPPPGETVLPDLAPAEPDSAAVAPAENAPAAGFAKPASRLPQIIAEAPDAGAITPPVPEAEPENESVLRPAPGAAPAGNKPRILTPGTGRTTEDGPVIIDVAPQQPVGAAPRVGFGQKVPGVQVNRLPRIGAEASEPAPDAGTAEDRTPDPAPETAVSRFGATFDNAEMKPVIALVLIDDGSSVTAAPDAIGEIGAPVTVALNPENTGASVLAQTHRLAGDEVAILAPEMPRGTTPSDLEVSYQAYVQTLPESVALVAMPNSPLQNDSQMAQHIASLLAIDGRGLVTSVRGLNPARQAAERAGLPYAGITRSLDEAGGDEAAILRLLDRAAFDATRGGPIVVMGRATPATVAAIRAWNDAGGHEAIIGPLSAVLGP